MKCPKCRCEVNTEQVHCPACGFTAKVLHGYLGSQWVRLERITDAAHCLRLEDSRRVEITLDDFERAFPQAFFAVYLGILPIGLTTSELGFWLLNQGAFNTHSVNRRNDFGIVLVVDPSARTASLITGYAIEGLFGDPLTTNILQKVAKLFSRGSFGPAIEAVCQRCSRVLKKHARKTPWQPESSAAPGITANMGLQPLRGGHRTAPNTSLNARHVP